MKLKIPTGLIASFFLAFSAATTAAIAQKSTVEGVINFTRLDSTIACAGTTKSTAVPELKKMGFVAIVNLRQASEEGADLAAEQEAAAAAGLKYFHIPFSVPRTPEENPDSTVQEFLRVTSDPANQPLLVHCSAGNRAAAMWLLKRVMNDGWDLEKAKAEADLVATPPARAIEWAVAYAKAHPKQP